MLALFRESKLGADAPLPFFFALFLRTCRQVVYTTFELNVLLIYAQEQLSQMLLCWNVTLLSYTNTYYKGVESIRSICCVFHPHFPQNVDNRFAE